MMKFEKYGDFAIFVEGEYLMRAHCSYGEVLDFVWSIHFEHPSFNVEIRVDCPGYPSYEE